MEHGFDGFEEDRPQPIEGSVEDSAEGLDRLDDMDEATWRALVRRCGQGALFEDDGVFGEGFGPASCADSLYERLEAADLEPFEDAETPESEEAGRPATWEEAVSLARMQAEGFAHYMESQGMDVVVLVRACDPIGRHEHQHAVTRVPLTLARGMLEFAIEQLSPYRRQAR